MKLLTAIPVYNEERHLEAVLHEVRRYSPHIVVINDGSTDRTPELLAKLLPSSVGQAFQPDSQAGKPDLRRGAGGEGEPTIDVVTHPQNRGYGAAIVSAFDHALSTDCDVLVTMDCDGQHEPARIPVLCEAIHDADIVSGSRYLRDFRQQSLPTPTDRRVINETITREINELLGLNLTDAFCGFKAYRCDMLAKFRITETGWGMPLQLWVQAAQLGLRVKEVGVPRLYLDPTRAFGGVLNDAEERLRYYRQIISDALADQFVCCDWPGPHSATRSRR